MKKFILLTFGFLGWAFYEMSGGADFEPASERMARLNPVDETEVFVPSTVAPQPEVVASATPKSTFIDTDPPLNDDVTRVSLNLSSLKDVQSDTDATEPTTEGVAQDVTTDTGVPTNVGVTLSSADTPAIIPSLIAPATDGVTPAVITSATSDLRTVSANRVNVRGGPGTDFGVVSKLARGDTVEVLQDNGDGWVKMRALDGGPEGWMADFLLAGG